jgi:hypothetical protein
MCRLAACPYRRGVGCQRKETLAPDGLGKAARTAGKLETIQIPGGTEALERIEVVEIVGAGVASRVRRPTLLGALLLKARALPVHPDRSAGTGRNCEPGAPGRG